MRCSWPPRTGCISSGRSRSPHSVAACTDILPFHARVLAIPAGHDGAEILKLHDRSVVVPEAIAHDTHARRRYGLYVGPMGHLYVLGVKTRRPVWHKNIWKDFGGSDELPRWAIVQNPLIYGDSLIVAPIIPRRPATPTATRLPGDRNALEPCTNALCRYRAGGLSSPPITVVLDWAARAEEMTLAAGTRRGLLPASRG